MLSSNDKKPLWGFIKAKKQDNVTISSLKIPDGQIITDPVDKVMCQINILKLSSL